jgi:tetratricopeptide (TPR) repeat protein
MTQARRVAIVALAAVLAGAAGRVAVARVVPAPAAPPPEAGGMALREAPAFSERDERDVQIRVWREAVRADPLGAAAMGQLAALYLQRAREGGTWADYLEAERLARRSLTLRTNRNAKTAVTLASDLLAQHRFIEARDVAAGLVAREPDVPQYRSLLGEVAMELGDDSTAAAMFGSLWPDRAHLSIAPRLARWAELTGNLAGARRLLDSATRDADRRADVPHETRALFHLRAGDLAFRMGRPRAAGAEYRAGLAIEPRDPRLQAAMARLSAARGNNREAIDWGDRAIAAQLDPGTLGVVGDAWAALGDSARSNEYYRAMEVAVSAQPGPYHRAWSLNLLDRGLRVDEVVRKALDELAQRHDVYGCDLAAWALHRAGRDREAAPVMRRALRLGTPDALLWFHQGVIARALGENALARTSLDSALALNPLFHAGHVAEARAVLDSIAQGR